MSLLTPTWLLLGLLAIPIVLMYMLKLRRRKVRVSSIMLWQMLMRDRQANAPWQRLKRNWLLFLQLLILAMLTVAMTRPALNIPQVASGSLVVLLDASASMAATDVSPNRFENARQTIRGLIGSLSRTSQMTLIQVASQPKVLAASENDKNMLYEKLDEAAVTHEKADWSTAFALAAGAVSSIQDDSATIVIVSDGGIPGEGLPPLPTEVRFVPVGNDGSNLAISALAVRSAGISNELFASVTNYGDQTRQVLFSVYLNNRLVKSQQLQVTGRDSTGISIVDFPPDPGIISARLSSPADAADIAAGALDYLSEDNIAFAINDKSTSRRVLITSPGNFFLDQIFAALPGIQSYRALPVSNPATGENQYILPDEQFDLYVLDRTLPTGPGVEIPQLPDGNILLVDPRVNPLFSVQGEFSPAAGIQVIEHNLTEHLDWDSVHINQARKVELPLWADVLVDSPEGPLVFVGETQGKRIAVLTFDLHNSDLPLQIAFPILFANLVDYLLPSRAVQLDGSLLPNENVEIAAPPGFERIVIASPDGTLYELPPSDRGFFFSRTEALGVYAVNFLSADREKVEYFAVNLFDAGESNITPSDELQIGLTSIPVATQSGLGQLENWSWFAALGLLILLTEWWFYHRHLTLSPFNWLKRS